MTFHALITTMLLTSFQSPVVEDSVALVNSGRAKLAQAGASAAQADIPKAIELMQAAIADLDRAVMLAPKSLEVRLARGIAYGAFPVYYDKSVVAREDLEIAVRHQDFVTLSEERRRRALDALERLGEGETPGDRFPEIAPETSPLLVVLTITFPSASGRDQAQARTAEVADAVAGFPGLLGKHLLASIDRPGMFVVLTWWKSKREASEFYYSELHQNWMRGRGQAIISRPDIPAGLIPNQVSVEVFGVLPGGVQINGGLLPK